MASNYLSSEALSTVEVFNKEYPSPEVTLAALKDDKVTHISLIDSRNHPRLMRRFMQLQEKMGKAMPELFVYDGSDAINAKAIANKVFLHRKLFEILDDKEVDAVISHELGHVYRFDKSEKQKMKYTVGGGTAGAYTSIAVLAAAYWVSKHKDQKISRRRWAGYLSTVGISSLVGACLGNREISRALEDEADDATKKTNTSSSLGAALIKIEEYNYSHNLMPFRNGTIGDFLLRILDGHRPTEARVGRLQ